MPDAAAALAGGPHALALALVQARASGEALSAAAWSGAVGNAEQAYALQDEVAQLLGWLGAEPAQYWKSGGASRQATLTHAVLAPGGVRSSPANLQAYPLSTRAVEAEIALRLGQSVSPQLAASLSPAQAEALVDACAVAIEVVDSRWLEGAAAAALLRLADAQSHGALVLGAWQPYLRRDWAAQLCQVSISDGRVVNATGTHPLGEPAWLLCNWLRHATRHGGTLASGSVVTTGSWVGMLGVQAGDLVRVMFDGIGSAELQL